MAALDPRLHPYRRDIAARYLDGQVAAARFVAPVRHRLIRSSAPVTATPAADVAFTSELVFGEAFDVYDVSGGFAWGQCVLDGYTGYVPAEALGDPEAVTDRITALTGQVYPVPDIKSHPRMTLPMGAHLGSSGVEDGFLRIAQGYVPRQHVAPLGATGYVEVAERFLGSPYLWGGRTACGIDCSGLVQVSAQAVGGTCQRDSDMQESGRGRRIATDVDLQRGDLVFWRGHVGIMQDAERLLHANAHHMAVTTEPLADVAARILASTGNGITSRLRPDFD